MPLACLRRPLAVAVAAYIALLCLLERRGAFRVPAPRELRYYTLLPSVLVEVRVLSGFAPKKAGDRFWLELLRVRSPGWEARGRWRAMAYLPRADPDTARLRPGMRVELRGRLRFGRAARNPGGFDERAFLERRGAALVLHARSLEVADARAARVRGLAEAFHRSLRAYLQRRFSPVRAGILEGMLLGYKPSLGPRLERAVQDAGAMHLLVPSGAKVAFVLAALSWVFRRSGVPRPARWAAAALGGGFYVLAVGGEPPYTRAYLAALAAAAGTALGRESGGFQGLVLAAALTLACEPRDLFSPGFVMTYAAVLALLIAMPRWRPPRRWPAAARRTAGALAAGLVVQAALWPVFAGVFGRGSRVGFLANLPLIPLSGAAMGAGFSAWALSGVPGAGPLERAAAGTAGRLADAFVSGCRLFAALPGAAADLAPMDARRTAAFYAGLSGALVLPERRAAAVLWAAALALGAGGPPPVRAVFLDGGRSSATVLAPGDGRCWLIGSGVPASAASAALRALGCRGAPEVWAEDARAVSWRRAARLARALGAPMGRPRAVALPAAALEGGSGPAVLSRGPWRVELSGPEAAVSRGGRMECCIMASPTRDPRPECSRVRSFSVRREGAAWVSLEVGQLHVTTQRRLGEIGRALP